MKADPVSKMSYEDAMRRLEEIVGEMEGGGLSLDASLALFEEAVRLSRHCRSRLDAAAGRVEVLLRGEDGELSLREMETSEER